MTALTLVLLQPLAGPRRCGTASLANSLRASKDDGTLRSISSALVFDQKRTPVTHVEKRQVIDGQQRGKQARAIVSIGIACFVLFGCSDKPAHSPEDEAEQSLMSDLARAVPELIQRLHARALLRGGVLVLRDDVTGFQAFPTVPTWKAECGVFGLNIAFFTSPSSDNYVTVNLTNASLTVDQCGAMLPLVAIEAKTYLDSSTAPSR